jgi:hypothetical protein
MKADFIQILLGLAIVVIGAAGAYAISVIASYYKTKKDQIIGQIENHKFVKDNELAKDALRTIDMIVSNVVSELDDTIKKEILKATEDGKLTDSEKEMLKTKAMDLIKSEISEPVKEAASSIIGDLNNYISTLIENRVTELKEESIFVSDNLPFDNIDHGFGDITKIDSDFIDISNN